MCACHRDSTRTSIGQKLTTSRSTAELREQANMVEVEGIAPSSSVFQADAWTASATPQHFANHEPQELHNLRHLQVDETLFSVRLLVRARCIELGNTQRPMRSHQPPRQNPQPSTLNTQHSTLNTQHSTLNPQHSTLIPAREIIRPGYVSSALPSELHLPRSWADGRIRTADLSRVGEVTLVSTARANSQHSTLNTQHSTLLEREGVHATAVPFPVVEVTAALAAPTLV
jgi:hypothetical protein